MIELPPEANSSASDKLLSQSQEMISLLQQMAARIEALHEETLSLKTLLADRDSRFRP